MNDLRKFIKNIIKEFLNEQQMLNSDGIWYHGSDFKKPNFDSDFKPIFFTKSKEYAEGYGKFVNSYKLNIKNPLDTRIEKDLIFYNEKFIPWTKEYKYTEKDGRYNTLDKGLAVPMITANLLYLFLRKSKREGLNHNYDGVIVDESGFEFDNELAKYSLFPLSFTQILNI